MFGFLLQSDAGSKVALGHNAHLHITYSAGLQALQLGKFSTALRCFQVRRILTVTKLLVFACASKGCIPSMRPCSFRICIPFACQAGTGGTDFAANFGL